jgi:hypothetical protein
VLVASVVIYRPALDYPTRERPVEAPLALGYPVDRNLRGYAGPRFENLDGADLVSDARVRDAVDVDGQLLGK